MSYRKCSAQSLGGERTNLPSSINPSSVLCLSTWTPDPISPFSNPPLVPQAGGQTSQLSLMSHQAIWPPRNSWTSLLPIFGCNELILIALDSTRSQASTHLYIPFPLPGTFSQVLPIPTQLPGELLFSLQTPCRSLERICALSVTDNVSPFFCCAPLDHIVLIP